MMFDIKYSRQAVKFLKNLDKKLILRILDKIDKLKEIPIEHDSKSVKGYDEKLFRVRIGDYRVLYDVDYDNNMVGIVKIDKRDKVY
ncbi:MAG: type II toxin-antitoxin system RelE/ParE family toxin [Candidatus Aenigmarchaeota archaeon]|nr:type II toxin-antitoxin system RelE/ParE family toxin [Candidatus Aenigmarchaeota archaeon]